MGVGQKRRIEHGTGSAGSKERVIAVIAAGACIGVAVIAVALSVLLSISAGLDP
jgi:hypothetical protein